MAEIKGKLATAEGNNVRLSRDVRARMNLGTVTPELAARLAVDLWEAAKVARGVLPSSSLAVPCVDVVAEVVS